MDEEGRYFVAFGLLQAVGEDAIKRVVVVHLTKLKCTIVYRRATAKRAIALPTLEKGW